MTVHGSRPSHVLSITIIAVIVLFTTRGAYALFDDDLVWQIGNHDGSSSEFGASAPLTYTVPSDWATRSDWRGFRQSISSQAVTIHWTQSGTEPVVLYLLTDYNGTPNPADFRVEFNHEEIWDGDPWYSSVRLYLPQAYQHDGRNTLKIVGSVEFDVINLNREHFDHLPLTGMYYLQEHPNGFESLYDIISKVQKDVDYGYMFNHIDGWETYCDWQHLEPSRGFRSFDNAWHFYGKIMKETEALFTVNPVETVFNDETCGRGFGDSADPSKRFQTFTANSSKEIAEVSVKIRKTGSGPWTDVTVDLYATSGGYPAGPSLASATIEAAHVDTDYKILTAPLTYSHLTEGTQYAIVLGQSTSGSASYEWNRKAVNAETSGKWDGTSWVDESTLGDGWLRVHGETGPERKLFVHNGLLPVWNYGTCWPIEHDAIYPQEADHFYHWLMDDKNIADHMAHSETIGESGLTWGGSPQGLVALYESYMDAVRAANPHVWNTGYPRCNYQLFWAMEHDPEAIASMDGTGWHYGGENNGELKTRHDLDARGYTDFSIVEDEGLEAHFPELSTWCEYQVASLQMVGPGYGVANNGWCGDGPINPDTFELNSAYYDRYVGTLMWSTIDHFSHRTFSTVQYGAHDDADDMWIGSCVKDGVAIAVIQNKTGAAQTVKAHIPVPRNNKSWVVRTYKYNGGGKPLKELSESRQSPSHSEVVVTGLGIPNNEHRVIKIYPSNATPEPGLIQVIMTANPRTLDQHGTTQLSLTGYNEDGATADLSDAAVTYRSTDPAIVSVNRSGLVTNLSNGGKPQIVRARVTLNGKTVESTGLTIYTAKKLSVSSSTSNTGTPANAHDGNLGTYWSYGKAGDYIQYDLGSSKSISRARWNYNLLDSPDRIEANYRDQFRHAAIKVSDDVSFSTCTLAKVMNFEDDFSDDKGWSTSQGAWSRSGGEYCQSNASATQAYAYNGYSGARMWDNYTLDAKITFVSGSNIEAGLAFRWQDVNNHYVVRFSHNQDTARLYKRVQGIDTQLGSAGTIASTSLNMSYSVRVVAEENGIRVYFNNDPTPVIDVADGTYASGKIGLYANNAVTFDDVAMEIIHEIKNSTDVYFGPVTGRYIRIEPEIYSVNNRFGELEVFGIQGPDPTVIDMSHDSGGTILGFGASGNEEKRFQTFTANSNPHLDKVEVKIKKYGSGSWTNVTVALYATNGNKPTGSALASTTIPHSDVGTSLAVETANLTYGNLVDGTRYAIVLGQSKPGNPHYQWAADSVNAEYFGKYNSGWGDESGFGDGWLKVYVSSGTTQSTSSHGDR
jgi:hypothetical protein